MQFTMAVLRDLGVLFNKCRHYSSQTTIKSKKLLASMSVKQNAKYDQFGNKKSVPRITLEVVGSGSCGESRSASVKTDTSRVLFNVGEGLHRVAAEHSIDLQKLKHIFITYNSWENTSGLSGILKTMTTFENIKITLHGPREPYHHILESELSLELPYPLQHKEYLHNGGIVNIGGYMQVRSVPIYPKVSNSTGLPESSKHLHEQSHTVRLPPQSCTHKGVSVVYVGQTFPQKGKPNFEKIKTVGITPDGLTDLIKGESVTLEDGKVVKPKDIMESDDPGSTFIVIEIPSEEHLASLLETAAFDQYKFPASRKDTPEVIVHFTAPHIMKNRSYTDWMDSFSSNPLHIVINEDCNSKSRCRMVVNQWKLNYLYPSSFPILNYEGPADRPRENLPFTSDSQGTEGVSFFPELSKRVEKDLKDMYGSRTSVYHAEVKLSYKLRPKEGLLWSQQSRKNKKCCIQELEEEQELQHILQQQRLKFLEVEKSLAGQTFPDYPSVTILGTGSACPSVTRNVSSVLVNFRCDTSVILDCGEGTFHQLFYMYGQEGAYTILRKLKAVYISHMHSDHHLGLITLLTERRKAFKSVTEEAPRLLLLAPNAIMKYLLSFHTNIRPVLDGIHHVNNGLLIAQKSSFSSKDYDVVCNCLKLKKLGMTFVPHAVNSFGVSLTQVEGQKIVYSGDTMPCHDLVDIGQNCDILIHEATFEEGMERDAKLKKHSTIPQAVQIGKEMNAKHILLTHFSQRYAGAPYLASALPENAFLCFDCMEVRIRDLYFLPHLYPALVSVFPGDYAATQMKAMSKNLSWTVSK